jgi:dihydrolipoamide dehydrogenase
MASSATEMITEATLAINLEATAEELVNTIHPHPTLAEMIMEAAHGIIDKSIHI